MARSAASPWVLEAVVRLLLAERQEGRGHHGVVGGHRVDEGLALRRGRVGGGGAGALRGVALLLGQLGECGGFLLDLGVDLFGLDADLLGFSLAGLGGLDDNGFAIGAYLDDEGGSDAGAVYAMYGSMGGNYYELKNDPGFPLVHVIKILGGAPGVGKTSLVSEHLV